MRIIIAQTILLVLTGTSIVNAGAIPVTLQGSWTLTERACTDDSAPNDRFQLGRDSMVIEIDDHENVSLETNINGESMQKGYNLEIEGSKFKTYRGGESNSFLYVISEKNELILFGAGFGKRGTCNEGEGLMSVFKRK